MHDILALALFFETLYINKSIFIWLDNLLYENHITGKMKVPLSTKNLLYNGMVILPDFLIVKLGKIMTPFFYRLPKKTLELKFRVSKSKKKDFLYNGSIILPDFQVLMQWIVNLRKNQLGLPRQCWSLIFLYPTQKKLVDNEWYFHFTYTVIFIL